VTAASAEVVVGGASIAVQNHCGEVTARILTRQIKNSLEQSWQLIKEAFDRRAWAALDYSSWDEYCQKELGTGLRRLAKESRRQAVAELTAGDQPMSNRAIAAAIGVDEGTVRNDRRAGAEFSAPDSAEGLEIRAESRPEQHEPVDEQRRVEPVLGDERQHEPVGVEQLQLEQAQGDDSEESEPATLRRVTGVDGRTYTTKPESKSRRRPLPDTFRGAARDLDKVVARLVRLAEDDRFRAHTTDLGAARCEVERAVDNLQKVLDALAEAGNG
jgi:hypothetical protein